MPAPLEIVYATDEDVFRLYPDQFPMLVPSSQVRAAGNDGVFQAGERWTLESESVQFLGRVSGGMVIELVKVSGRPFHWPASGLYMAIETVTLNSVILANIGEELGVGEPPGPVGGLEGVEFFVRTLYPQIEDASFELNRRYGIDPRIPSRMPTDLYEIRDLRRACIQMVVEDRIASAVRSDDDRLAKLLEVVRSQIKKSEERLGVRWNDHPEDFSPFGTRVDR